MTSKNQEHILFSYSFNDLGDVIKLHNSEAAYELRNPGLSWIHLDATNKSTKKWLQKEVNYLDSIIIDALVAEETRPRILKFENGVLLILRGVSEAKSDKNVEMVSLRMWIDNERIISIQRRSMQSMLEIQKKLFEGLKIKSTGEFLHNFLNITLQNVSEFIYGVGEGIDDIEQEVLTTRDIKYRGVITHTRSQLTVARRYIYPLKDVIGSLKISNYDWADELVARHFQENFDKITHIIEEIDEILTRSKILHDELFHALNEKINHNMFKLSMIAIIFMPLTFITSLFGMNFQKIPWAENPYGFYVTCIVMALIATLQMFLFKQKDWF